MMLDLTGQVALVTGGTQGIGWAMVQALADQRATVYACGFSQASLDQAAAELPSLPWPDRIHLKRCDVTDKTAVIPYIHDIYTQTERIDILINNAAYVQWDPITHMTIEQAERSMAVGYNGMVYTIKTILPLMQTAGRGHIVNIASIAGLILVGGTSAAYAGTKAAIDTYTRILQMELAGTPIHATVVRLSTVAGTNFFKKHVPMSRMAPLTKYFAPLTPPDVATAVLRAIAQKQDILHLPRYTHFTYLLYIIAPRFSRWLANLGGANQRDYANVDWRYK